jgi:hypothetical protein
MRDAETARESCPTEPALAACLAVHAVTLKCLSEGRAPSADERKFAEGRVADAPNDDARFALRLFARVGLPPETRAPSRLEVGEGGAWFTPPSAREPVDLSRRPSLARVLGLLATRRHDHPLEPVSIDEIVRAGWPGEKIVADAALNRARVALATLRKLGLREVLVHGEGGYWLGAEVGVVAGAAKPAAAVPSGG